ncbi:D-threonine aldolase [Anatilimnocola aggregata]|uniref:D-threonine aldolase n=1 Tax=Anatilimnocola aggregata TaxID=2528021 RepID=A0A517Y9L7_9BACT|nr:DSD1 family PLP-dependent enzyme [Anatilimnocola aggregata]QDU26916.1 D-threonine aldolase [Anatilimnocola aggregata]
MTRDDLDTPALCLDLDAFDDNVRDVATLCALQNIDWRPHAKCHKSPIIGQRLIDAGAIGLTCAKLGEAEIFGAAGIQDLLIANMLVGPKKVARLVELRKIADPIVAVDHLDQAQPLSEALHRAGLRARCILEVDIGLNRVGVQPGAATLALAQAVDKLPGLELVGIMGYEGHLMAVADQEEKSRRVQESLELLVAQQHLIGSHGLQCDLVSCGGTGTIHLCSTQPGITEIQAGGAIFMDAFYRQLCLVPGFQFALTVLTTVVSRPTPERAIIDAGRKTLNIEIGKPFVKDRPDLKVQWLSAEHGTLLVEGAPDSLKIGDRLELIPGYGDLTIMLHEQFHCFRGRELVETIPVAARGKLQ